MRNREGLIFEGQVKNLTSINDDGEFDVLSYHANFISLINEKLILRLLDNTDRVIKFDRGVMRVVDNNIDVYLGVKEENKSKREEKN
ncbi:hypothetical protein JXA63_00450 [Candidatus Woesebacteria bacterium]|nr:hypothetical protein [Candidatus Woesebacteria bacterium]